MSPYHFRGQHENEFVLRVIHRHWLDVTLQLLPLFLLLLVLLFVAGFIPSSQTLLSPEFFPFFYFLISVFLMALWIAASLIFVDYYLDVWVVTNERIINIEQKGLFARTISELRFEKVQDVTSEVHGFLPTFFDYGDVFVQTAGETGRFLFDNIPHPNRIKDLIVTVQERIAETTTPPIAEILEAIEHTKDA